MLLGGKEMCGLDTKASAREILLTSALKSSPPPELIFAENHTRQVQGLATTFWLQKTGDRRVHYQAASLYNALCDTPL
jgi:hypothetical protein